MSESSARTKSGEDRNKLDCAQNPGTRGEAWEQWQETWTEFAQAEYEYQDDSSWLDTTENRDHGSLNGAALPVGGAQLQEATRKRRRRQFAVTRALARLQTDSRLRKLIVRLPPGDGLTNDAAGNGIGRRAWMLLEQECGETMTALEIRKYKKEFADVGIATHVGYSRTSIALTCTDCSVRSA